jgi:hypothetical protein
VRRRATRFWLLRRKQRSAYNTLFKELHTEDPNEFRNYFRMDKTTFKMLLEKVRPLIERQDTKLREAISAAQSIKILFWNDEMMFTKQKHMVIKRRERENQ